MNLTWRRWFDSSKVIRVDPKPSIQTPEAFEGDKPGGGVLFQRSTIRSAHEGTTNIWPLCNLKLVSLPVLSILATHTSRCCLLHYTLPCRSSLLISPSTASIFSYKLTLSNVGV